MLPSAEEERLAGMASASPFVEWLQGVGVSLKRLWRRLLAPTGHGFCL